VRCALVLAAFVVTLLPRPALALLEASDFSSMVGFSVVAYTRVKGDYYGTDPARPVELDNGMVFAFPAPFSTYAYRPYAVVFERSPAKGAATAYKLLIQDRLYDAKRLK
jgi:hypothetical protein